jgi:putative hydrolase of the HAD superfamily
VRIVFDLGGVVYRWQPDEILMRALPERAPTRAAAAALAGAFFQGVDGDWSEFDRGTLEAELLAERSARRLGFGLEETRAIIAAVPDELQPLPGTVALASRLRAHGHGLHYLSNMPRPYAQALTGRDDLFGLFDGGVFSSHVGLLKPEPAMFVHAARAFGADPRDLLLLDDAPRNVAAARAQGWQALLFRDAPSCARELEALGVVTP